MATLIKRGRSYVVRLNNEARSKISLGRVPKGAAETMRAHIAALESAAAGLYAPPIRTAEWLAAITDDLHAKLVHNGLAEPRGETRRVTIGEMVARVEAERTDWKESTRRSFRTGAGYLLERFDSQTPLDDFTTGDALAFSRWLTAPKGPAGKGLSKASAAAYCAKAFQIFEAAIDYELVGRNPFRKTDRSAYRGRKAFVTADLARRVLAGLPTAETRLAFALGRWGGLRLPSEALPLRWGDVDFERRRFRVTCQKTSRHKGREFRMVPIFPELATTFDDVWDEAEEGAEWVFAKMRKRNPRSFNSYLKWKVAKLGIDPWPRLCHSLRSTRQNELREVYPDHVVCAWCGNSKETAAKHYYEVQEQHFEAAIQVGPFLGPEAEEIESQGAQPATAANRVHP